MLNRVDASAKSESYPLDAICPRMSSIASQRVPYVTAAQGVSESQSNSETGTGGGSDRMMLRSTKKSLCVLAVPVVETESESRWDTYQCAVDAFSSHLEDPYR